MAQTRIFISHSHHDNDWCRPFAEALKAIGYDVWYDETGLQGGAAWVAGIQHEVETRDVFLIVLTPEAWASQWVQDELQLAIATRRRIMPVLLRNTQVSGFLLTTQWITVIGEEAQAAARAAVLAIEAPPAPGRNGTPEANSETLADLITLCKSLAAEERYTEALSACARALALDSNNCDVLKIRAYVSHAIGDLRMEGRSWFQILLISPNDVEFSVNGPGRDVDSMWGALDDEDQVIKAYSLRSSKFIDPYKLWFLDDHLLGGLRRLNRLDAAPSALVQLSDVSRRMRVCAALRDMKRDDLAVRLLEEWYGYPPRLNTVVDIPALNVYGQALVGAGRSADADHIRSLIIRIFETAYSRDLRSILRFQFPSWDIDICRTYLAALYKVGRAKDANRLRKAYPYLS